jgi:hypothetical protein
MTWFIRARARIARRQRRVREDFVHVAADRLRLVEPEIALLENRNAAEGVHAEMLRSFHVRRRHGVEPILGAFSFSVTSTLRRNGLPGIPWTVISDIFRLL